MVVNGITRRVGSDENCWESDGLSVKGEKLDIAMEGFNEIRQIRLTFDPNLTGEIMPSITKKVLEKQVKDMPLELIRMQGYMKYGYIDSISEKMIEN